MHAPEQMLDPQVWLLWLAAAMSVPLLSRNPFPLVAAIMAVIYVRAAWSSAANRLGGRGFVALLIAIAGVSTVVNVLTAPFGEQVIATLPGWWPGAGVLTFNALLYGLLTGLAIVTIVLAATTAAALIDWPAMLRLLPQQFLSLAVAASVAWSFIPQTVLTLGDIRDAQWARGIAPRSGRAVLPLVMPLLTTSLDRATTMAEALESRGFGGETESGQRRSRRPAVLTVAAITLAVPSVYLIVDGQRWPAGVCAVLCVAAASFGFRCRTHDHRSRYRRRRWQIRDTMISAISATSLAATGFVAVSDRAALRYDPYPTLSPPHVSLVLIAACGLLLAPVPLAPRRPQSQSAAQRALAPSPRSTIADTGTRDRPGSRLTAHRRAIRHIYWPARHYRRPWATWPPRYVRSGARSRWQVRNRGERTSV